MNAVPTTPPRPHQPLPTPPPTGHRLAKHRDLPHRSRTDRTPSNTSPNEVEWAATRAERKGILGELDYLVSRVENTVTGPTAAQLGRAKSGHAVDIRPPAKMDGRWWIGSEHLDRPELAEATSAVGVAGSERSRQPFNRPPRQPLHHPAVSVFFDADTDDEENEADKDNDDDDDENELASTSTLVGPGSSEESGEGDIEMINASGDVSQDRRLVLATVKVGTIAIRPGGELVPHKASNPERSLQLRFDVGERSLVRKRTRDEEADVDDFAITGAVIKTKYARVEDEEDERERSSTPLVEVQPCRTCGCTCGGIKREDEVDGGGPARRGGRSSSLSNKVKGNILAALLGNKESLRDKAGGSVANWADLAEKLGADRGQHDTVRRAARFMQERLPEMMRRGQI